MRITAGILVLVAAVLCLSTGSCNIAGALVSKMGRSAIGTGLKMLEQNVGSAGRQRVSGERDTAAALERRGEKVAMERIKKRAGAVLEELDASSATMLWAGALSLLGGLLAYAASVLLLVERSRAFVLLALVVAMAGTGASLLTPFTVAALQVGKLLLLGFGVLAGATIKERAP